jgi:hypothetical protein
MNFFIKGDIHAKQTVTNHYRIWHNPPGVFKAFVNISGRFSGWMCCQPGYRQITTDAGIGIPGNSDRQKTFTPSILLGLRYSPG